MYRLSRSLERDPSVLRGRDRSPNTPPRHRSPSPWQQSRNIERSDYSYGAAVDRLRNTLKEYHEHQKVKEMQFSPRVRKKTYMNCIMQALNLQ